MARFTLPRDIYHGEGALEELKNLKGKKAIVVVGGGAMKRQGFLAKVEDYLKEAGMEVALFEGVEPDPSVETVKNMAGTTFAVYDMAGRVVGAFVADSDCARVALTLPSGVYVVASTNGSHTLKFSIQ